MIPEVQSFVEQNQTLLKAIGSVLGWVWGTWQWFTKRRERRKAKRAEEELAIITDRREAPFFVPCARGFNNIYPSAPEGGGVMFFPAGSPNVLSLYVEEVPSDLDAGHDVYLLIDNIGKPWRTARFTLDGKPIRLRRDHPLRDSDDLQYLVYQFQPNHLGKAQELVIEFETESGVVGRHIYETIHGKRALARIKPAGI